QRAQLDIQQVQLDELKYRKRIEEAEEAAEAATRRVAEVKATAEAATRRAAEAEQAARGQVSALEAQLRTAQGEREAAKKRAEALEAARAALKAQLRAMQRERETAKNRAEALEAARAALEAQLQSEAEKARAACGQVSTLEAQLCAAQGERETATEVVPRWRALPPEMTLIPAGSFLRGSSKVTLSRPFLMMTTPVTQWQWREVMGDNPSYFSDRPDSEQRPVENVSWLDVMVFCNALSKREGGMREAYQQVGAKWRRIDGADGYRLPTEAEWEYACRAGTKTAYWSSGKSKANLARVGWYNEKSENQTHPVGEKTANPYGLFDMHGNVWEWVNDWYGSYPNGDVTDPKGPSKGSSRVVRGGSWFYDANIASAANRFNCRPSNCGGDLGFRLVRTPRRLDGFTFPSRSISVSPAPPAPGLPAPGDLARLEAAQRAPVASISEVSPRWRALPPEMVLIPAGSFLMGSPKGEGHDDEQPQHKVTLSRPFLMMTTPVTQWQWHQVMGDNPSDFSNKPDSKQRPVKNVSWFDVMAFCNALSKREGWMREAYQQVGDECRRIDGADGYRLPTEAEWEYACRAGTKTAYWSGENKADLARVGWYGENSGGRTHPVGEKPANPYGLFDMHGNVWEWVDDWYGDYPNGDVTDPKGPSKGSIRVMRGGSWSGVADFARAARRKFAPSSYRNRSLGFRLVRTPR
ncbi:SUMF1/EgtB/PvdO family nonheme iron enzyme, partial [Myxococcota bacterium]|nr:SUMF1/EgtB/PvdO family nonheme iron enzyme [Myxococcota bacterium]